MLLFPGAQCWTLFYVTQHIFPWGINFFPQSQLLSVCYWFQICISISKLCLKKSIHIFNYQMCVVSQVLQKLMCSKWNLSSPPNLLLFLCFLSQVKVPLFILPGLSQEPKGRTVLSFNLSAASWPYIFPIKHHLTTSTYYTSWICLYSWIYLEYIYIFNISHIYLFFYFSNVTALVQVLINSCLNLQHPLNCSL